MRELILEDTNETVILATAPELVEILEDKTIPDTRLDRIFALMLAKQEQGVK